MSTSSHASYRERLAAALDAARRITITAPTAPVAVDTVHGDRPGTVGVRLQMRGADALVQLAEHFATPVTTACGRDHTGAPYVETSTSGTHHGTQFTAVTRDRVPAELAEPDLPQCAWCHNPSGPWAQLGAESYPSGAPVLVCAASAPAAAPAREPAPAGVSAPVWFPIGQQDDDGEDLYGLTPDCPPDMAARREDLQDARLAEQRHLLDAADRQFSRLAQGGAR